MRKWVVIFMLFFAVLDGAGCATVQKKFTRKKKEPSHIAAVMTLEEGAYQKKFSNVYYYKTHFTLWKSWHDELLNQWGGNTKKVIRCAEEAYGNLTEMNRYLVPEKQNELKPQLETLSQITKRLEEGGYSDSERGAVRVELEKVKRIVDNDFYYDKVKDAVLPDVVDLGGAAQTTPQNQ